MFPNPNGVHGSQSNVLIGSHITGQVKSITGATGVFEALFVVRQQVAIAGLHQTALERSQRSRAVVVGTVNNRSIKERGDCVYLLQNSVFIQLTTGSCEVDDRFASSERIKKCVTCWNFNVGFATGSTFRQVQVMINELTPDPKHICEVAIVCLQFINCRNRVTYLASTRPVFSGKRRHTVFILNGDDPFEQRVGTAPLFVFNIVSGSIDGCDLINSRSRKQNPVFNDFNLSRMISFCLTSILSS